MQREGEAIGFADTAIRHAILRVLDRRHSKSRAREIEKQDRDCHEEVK